MKKDIKCLENSSRHFPKSLKLLKKCPKELFVLGDEKILSEFSLGVIGSRRCSVLGKEIARKISEDLVKENITIVSGFARGIDTIAHKVCIENDKKTIAVLGGGHRQVYPRENRKMVDEILNSGGAIISEYPFDYPPLPSNFIERNRIIAALSEGIILIEAKLKSGSLNTIEQARKLNKKIFVVPGALNDEMYEGSNMVLSEDAFCIRNAKDILKRYEKFNLDDLNINVNEKISVNKNFEEIYNLLKFYPISLEEICAKTDKHISVVLYQLTMLEFEGVVKRVEGQSFVRNK